MAKKFVVVYLEAYDDDTEEWSVYGWVDTLARARQLAKEAWKVLSKDNTVVDPDEIEVWDARKYYKYAATGIA